MGNPMTRQRRSDVDYYEVSQEELRDGGSEDAQPIDIKLLVAITEHDNEIVRRLLQDGADPNVTDQRGHPALIFACECNNRVGFDLLCKAGARVPAMTRLYLEVLKPMGANEGAAMLASYASRKQS
jgi:ankyrin repeat protein